MSLLNFLIVLATTTTLLIMPNPVLSATSRQDPQFQKLIDSLNVYELQLKAGKLQMDYLKLWIAVSDTETQYRQRKMKCISIYSQDSPGRRTCDKNELDGWVIAINLVELKLMSKDMEILMYNEIPDFLAKTSYIPDDKRVLEAIGDLLKAFEQRDRVSEEISHKYCKAKAYGKAMEVARVLRKHAPNNVNYMMLESLILASSGKFNEAKQLLKQVKTTIDTKSKAETYLLPGYAIVYPSKEKQDAAIAQAKKSFAKYFEELRPVL